LSRKFRLFVAVAAVCAGTASCAADAVPASPAPEDGGGGGGAVKKVVKKKKKKKKGGTRKARKQYVDSPERRARIEWWKDARFGIFIHWGAYSVLGGEWKGKDYGKEVGGPSAEWIMRTARISKEEYAAEAASKFNPVKYDPGAWADLAKRAGAGYMVLTTKHHDGWALFDTKAGKWGVMFQSPYKKDIVAMFAEACRKRGLRVGFYYSHRKDWVNNKNNVCGPEYLKLVETQVTELLTKYGKVDVMWFDMGRDGGEVAKLCRSLVRKHQPDCLISGRIGGMNGDFSSFGDRRLPPPGSDIDGETCMTMRLNWGYDRDDDNWKSPGEVVAMLSKCACRGANFLLNVGPKPDGTLCSEEVERLEAVGKWMDKHAEAIRGTRGSPFGKEFEWGSATIAKDGSAIYLHIWKWPGSGYLELDAAKTPDVSRARFLSGGGDLEVVRSDDGGKLRIEVGSKPPIKDGVPVVKLETK